MARLIDRFHNYPDDHLLTRAEVAHLLNCSTSVIGNRSYAGLLPMIPGKPTRYFVGDVKAYIKIMGMNGRVQSGIHRSMRVAPEDRQAWSPLHGVSDFRAKSIETTVNLVLKETGYLWKKYKELRKQKVRKAGAS